MPKAPVTPSATDKPTSDRVRLVPSALFYVASYPIPKGIRSRDMAAMVQGLVDEHSPLPLEQTSWGFLLDNRGLNSSHFLYYAGAKDLVFKSASDAVSLSETAVLPAFVATQGLSFDTPTWVFFLENECLSALFFEQGSNVPTRLVSRFLSDILPGTDSVFLKREEMLRSLVKVDSDENIAPGLIRISETTPRKNKTVSFQLQRCESENDDWRDWKRTEFKKTSRLLAADVRDHTTLLDQQQRAGLGRRLGQIATVVAITVAALLIFEFLQFRRQSEAAALAQQVTRQAPEVQRLQDIEAMVKTLKTLFDQDFQPYRWLMELNTGRPDSISFTSFAVDDQGSLVFNGQSPEVKTLNEYKSALDKNPRFKQPQLSNLKTDKDGVTFTIKSETGNLQAELPAELLTPPPAAEDPNEPAPDTEVAQAAPPVHRPGQNGKKNPNRIPGKKNAQNSGKPRTGEKNAAASPADTTSESGAAPAEAPEETNAAPASDSDAPNTPDA